MMSNNKIFRNILIVNKFNDLNKKTKSWILSEPVFCKHLTFNQ